MRLAQPTQHTDGSYVMHKLHKNFYGYIIAGDPLVESKCGLQFPRDGFFLFKRMWKKVSCEDCLKLKE